MLLNTKYPGEENVDIVNALIFTSSGELILGYKAKIGTWIPLGGKKNPHESNKECLVREIHEESSQDMSHLNMTYIGSYNGETPTTKRSIRVAVYTIIINIGEQLIPKNEIQKIEKKTIEGWLIEEKISPITREILDDIMQVNMQLEEK